MQSISYTYTSIHSTKNIIEFTQYLAVYPKHDLKFPSSHMGGRLLPAGCQVQRWQTQTKPIQNFHGNCPSIPYLLNSKSQTIKKKNTILQKKNLETNRLHLKRCHPRKASHLFQPLRKGWKANLDAQQMYLSSLVEMIQSPRVEMI